MTASIETNEMNGGGS